jgi:hypothetical protein
MLSDGLCPSCERIFGAAAVRRRQQIDLAYAGYAVLGVFFVCMAAWMLGLIDFGFGLVLLVIGFPLLFVIPALVIAIALSLKHWQHLPFRVLSAMTVLVVVLGVVSGSFENPLAAVIVYGLYGFAVFWFAWAWFRRLRQQFFVETEPSEPAMIGRLFQ